MALPEAPTRTVRLGASWLVSSTDSATKQAGRPMHVAYAGGYLYIATLGADRLERVAGGSPVIINSLVRINATTKEYDPNWVVNFNLTAPNCEVWSLQTDGTTVYIGGNFSSITINGTASIRAGLAAVNGLTGVITSQFSGWTISSAVRALALDGDILYFGGDFSTVNAVGRSRLAAANISAGGSTLTSFNCGIGARVNDLDILPAASGSQIIVGMNAPGTIAGSGSYTIGAVSPAGARLWGANPSPAGVNAVCAAPSGTRAAAGAKGSLPTGGNTAWVYTDTGALAYAGIQTNGDIQAIAIGTLSYGREMLFIGNHDVGFGTSPGGSPTAAGIGFALYQLSNGAIQSYRPQFAAGAPGNPWTGSFLKVWSIEIIESLGWMVVGGDFTQVKQSNGTNISPSPYRLAIYEDPTTGPPPPPPPPPSPATTFTLMSADGATIDGSSFTTASISPKAGKAVFVGLAATRLDSIQPSAPTITGANITFTEQSSVNFDTVAPDMATGWVYTGITLTPGVGPLTIDFGTQPIASCAWNIVEATDVAI